MNLYCEKVLREAELNAEKESITLISDFQGKKKHKMRELEEHDSKADVLDEYQEEITVWVDLLEDDLMTIEMRLQDALAVATDNFKEKVKNIS